MKELDLTTFQGLIMALQSYWSCQGCTIVQPFDMEVGAGTFHPMTYFKAIGPEPVFIAYVQPSRRPSDGRYGKNSNRLQYYYQFQVIIKPSPKNIQDLYLDSLEQISLSSNIHDIRFIEDNWENPTLGAYGLGWEVWLNSMEITQFTYFQQMGGLECKPVTGEITYGLERIAMIIQNVDNVYDILWNKEKNSLINITYGDILLQNEIEQSTYNFEYTDINFLFFCLKHYEKEIKYLLSLDKPLLMPAYERIINLVHTFNLLEARKAMSFIERQNYILKIRNLTKTIAEIYYFSRKKLGFPNCNFN